MEKDPFKEYLRESEPDKADKGYAWSTAIGLQAVDGLKPSKYLIDIAIQNIEGEITMKEAQGLIDRYYEEKPVHLSDGERTEEADKVSSRIAEMFSETAFSFSPNEYISIHRKLFQGIYNRNLHISGLLTDEKVDIELPKVDIQNEKVDIESLLSKKGKDFSVKTTVHIQRLFEKFGFDEIFGRSAVMELLGLKGSGASKLLSNLVQSDMTFSPKSDKVSALL